MGATRGKLEVLPLEKSTIESVRNCPPEILARIASFLGQRECKRIGEFLPEMEDAFEIAIKMNWFSYLRGADCELGEKIDRGFVGEDNFLKHSRRISSLMSQDKKKTSVVHMPRHIKWRQCPTLGYEKLYLESVCWLEFTTKMTVPRATDLHLYFKENVKHPFYSLIIMKNDDYLKDVFRKQSFCGPSNTNTRNNDKNC